MSRIEKRSSAGKKVAVFFIVLIIIEALAIFGIVKVFKNKDVTPSKLGYSLYLMDSGNMGDDVPKDALVLAENGSISKDKIGKAVLCENVPGVGTSVFWLADVESKGDKTNGVNYKLVQSNNYDKVYTVKSDKDVVGVAKKYFPTAGKIIKFVKTKVGMAIAIAIPLLLLIFLEILIAIVKHATGKKYVPDDDDYDDIEEVDDGTGDSLEDFLNEKHGQKEQEEEVDDEKYDISFGDSAMRPNSVDSEFPESIDDMENAVEDAVDADDSELEEAETPAVEIPAPPRDVEESVTSTKNAASSSLEELMKMMEEEQEKLKEQLKED